MGLPEAPRAVSVGLRSCYLWHFRGAATRFHLARFQHPLKALKPSQQLCPGTSRGPTNCFCWASKLLSGPSTTFFWASKLPSGLFQQPFNALKLAKPLSSFAMRPRKAPCAVSVGLRSCYLAFPRRYNLFLLGFETAIWHVSSSP